MLPSAGLARMRCRRLPAQPAVRPMVIVVQTPAVDNMACLGKAVPTENSVLPIVAGVPPLANNRLGPCYCRRLHPPGEASGGDGSPPDARGRACDSQQGPAHNQNRGSCEWRTKHVNPTWATETSASSPPPKRRLAGSASGVHPKVAQTLARHSDIRLTLDTYTHVLGEQQIEAINCLPDLSASPKGITA